MYLRIRHITHLSHAQKDDNQCTIAQHADDEDEREQHWHNIRFRSHDIWYKWYFGDRCCIRYGEIVVVAKVVVVDIIYIAAAAAAATTADVVVVVVVITYIAGGSGESLH